MRSVRRMGALSALVLGLMSGCGGRHDRVAEAPPPPPRPMAMPVPPQGASPAMTVPVKGPNGQRMTPNQGLSDKAALWHMRMALNVAALSCHGAADAVRLQYNGMLKTHRAVLASANSAVDAEYKARFGASAGFAAREATNTKVYNFFALPPVQTMFCERAVMVGGAVATMSAAQLSAYARSGLASLEQPFLDFYDAYADYQVRLAQWRGGQRVGDATPASVAPVAMREAPAKLAIVMSEAELMRDDDVTMRAERSAVRLAMR